MNVPRLAFCGALWAFSAAAQSLVIDLPVGSQLADVHAATTRVCAGLADGSATTATLLFAAGRHNIDMATSTLFEVTGCAAPVGGRLVIAGAGMDVTSLVLATHGNTVLDGKQGWARLTVRDLTFARPAATATQATIVAVAADGKHLTLETARGFPSIAALLVDRLPRLGAEQGLYLRRYRAAAGAEQHPRLVTDLGTNGTEWPPNENAQVRFVCGGDGERCPDIEPVAGSPRQVKLKVAWGTPGEQQRYAKAAGDAGTVVGVKVKHGGQTFYLSGGDDVAFLRVRWLDHSRGIVKDSPNVLLRDTRVEHSLLHAKGLSGAGAALATPGGGPQIRGWVHNVTVSNHTSAGTGDDALGLFGILSGSVTGCHISDSFARGILLSNVSDEFAANVKGNAVVRCPVFRTS